MRYTIPVPVRGLGLEAVVGVVGGPLLAAVGEDGGMEMVLNDLLVSARLLLLLVLLLLLLLLPRARC